MFLPWWSCIEGTFTIVVYNIYLTFKVTNLIIFLLEISLAIVQIWYYIYIYVHFNTVSVLKKPPHKSAFWPRLSCIVTSVLLTVPLSVWQMLGLEWQLVAMATKMGPVEGSPVALDVQAAAWFTVAVLGRVLGDAVIAAGVQVLLGRLTGRHRVILCVKRDTIWQ